ncbi:MAG: hypothetical protein AAFV29_10475, partial [Myxococcota bacterium]
MSVGGVIVGPGLAEVPQQGRHKWPIRSSPMVANPISSPYGAKRLQGSTFEADKPPEPEQEHPLMRQVRGALGNLEAKGTGGDVGMIGTPTVDEFETISPGEGPDYFANGRFTFENIVNDDILVSEQLTPPDWRPGIKQAVKDNFHLPFFQDNFANESEAYQFLVHMANLESAGGTTFHNDEDALDSGGG